MTYTATCGNDRFLTPWVRPRIKLESSRTLCWVLNLLSHHRDSLESLFYTTRQKEGMLWGGGAMRQSRGCVPSGNSSGLCADVWEGGVGGRGQCRGECRGQTRSSITGKSCPLAHHGLGGRLHCRAPCPLSLPNEAGRYGRCAPRMRRRVQGWGSTDSCFLCIRKI